MTRLEALEAVAAAARDLLAHERVYLNDLRSGSPLRIGRAGEKRAALLRELRRSVVTLNALDQAAPQPPGVDPQPHRGSVADTAGIFAGGPDSVEWLREQRGVPMIPDLLAQAYGEEQR